MSGRIGSFPDRCATARPLRRAASTRPAPRSGWRGTMMVRMSGHWRCNRACVSSNAASSSAWVEAAIHVNRSPILLHQSRKSERINGERRHVELEMARDRHATAAEALEPRRILGGLAQADIDMVEERTDEASRASPTPGRSLGNPGVDERQSNAGVADRVHEVRPEFGLGEKHEIRLPMIEETPHRARQIQRHELVPDPGR